jgi:hypothetical protein
MNTLSWYIYLIGLVESVTVFFGFIMFVSIAATLIIFLVYISSVDHLDEDDDRLIAYRKLAFTRFKISVSVFAISSLICIFTPSRQTLILIGASEFGERIMKSEAVNSIVDPSFNLLKTWIEQQTKSIEQSSNRR